MSAENDASLNRRYDLLWQSAEAAFARGEVQMDGHLQNREADRRRGLTLMLRLDEAAAHAIGAYINELKQVEPRQYFYAPEQYHVTVLSLQTATSDYDGRPERIEAYARALGEAVAGLRAFKIRFEGVTATAEAVLIRGFPEQDSLSRMREKIFETMAARGLPVTQRYAPETAHVTVMRFACATENLATLAESLRSKRTRNFGTSEVRKIEMVENDWYMSADRLRVIRGYELE